MSQRQHPTTRRAFITTMGFAGVSLYGAWAVYGAAPLPFAGSPDSAAAGTAAAAGGHSGHGGGGSMSPEEFLRNHEEFIARFSMADGSVAPRPEKPQVAADQTMFPMPSGDHVSHNMSDMPAMPDMPAAIPGSETSSQHGSDPHAASGSAHATDGTAVADVAGPPIDVYLLAYRFGFEPEELRLEAGRAYRFRMMASDISHGASLSFGSGSRVIRLRPNVVSEQTMTFQRRGQILVYCTVFCGPAHDAMKARILVA